MQVSVDDLAVRLAQSFHGSGHELYLVGGAVRDSLLGRGDYDLDFATSATPPESARVLENFSGSRPYRTGEQFGTIGIRVDDRVIEVTTYRSSETYVRGSRKPAVLFGQKLTDDLLRRDFTINSMAVDPERGSIVDPYGGLADLERRTVRTVGDASLRFQEDPLRLLRAIRFAATLGFGIDPSTWAALVNAAGTIHTISRERVRDEFSKILVSEKVINGLSLLRDSGLLVHSVPGLIELTRMPDHGPNHPLSLWDHTMRVVQNVPTDVVLRWAALLHDIAKPSTRTLEPDGRVRFFHHEDRGASISRDLLLSLKYANHVVDDVTVLVATHMQLHAYSDEWTDGAVRRLWLRLGPLFEPALKLAHADASGHSLHGRAVNAPKFAKLEQRARELTANPEQLEKSPLSGNDLMQRFQRPPGPWIREIKDALREEIVEGRLDPTDLDKAWLVAESVTRARPIS